MTKRAFIIAAALNAPPLPTWFRPRPTNERPEIPKRRALSKSEADDETLRAENLDFIAQQKAVALFNEKYEEQRLIQWPMYYAVNLADSIDPSNFDGETAVDNFDATKP